MKTLYLKKHGPFYKYLIAYQSIGVSLINLVIKELRPIYENDRLISYGSKTDEIIFQHINEIIIEFDENLNKDTISELVACMFINICYETVSSFNDKSPEFEFFRHIRNAASHNNTFCFKEWEPSRPAKWRGIDLDTSMKGSKNPFQGQKCIGNIIGSADLLYLINDIEKIIPEDFYDCEICRESKT